MKVSVLKPIRIDRLGLIRKGQEVELPESIARLYLSQGAVELYQTKVLRENPIPAVGELSSALPAAPASPQTIAPESESGGKRKRGRPKKER